VAAPVAAPGLTVAADRNFRDEVDHRGAESEPDISA
jgi:hypothetical protein